VRHLAERVRTAIRRRQLLKPGDRVAAGVSAGADSVALLRLLLELREDLGIVLSVAHFNHQLRGADADADEQFVQELSARHRLGFHCERADVAGHAAASRLSVEASARQMRYGFFERLLSANKVDRVATGHTLDDQAETVLLRITRGAGTRGLAGIYPQILSCVAGHQDKAIIRPILGFRRGLLEEYLTQIGQQWREDKSNRDLRFARNRVRHGILPRLEKALNPAVREALAEAADLARAEEEYWQRELKQLVPKLWESDQGVLRVAALIALPLAVQRRAVRAVSESLGLRPEFRHVEELLALAAGEAKSAVLPGGWTVSRSRDALQFRRRNPSPQDFEYTLPVPGSVAVPEAGSCFEAAIVPVGAPAGYNRGQLLNPELLAKTLQVRNWRPGDRFWPAHTKSPRKIKELLQERRITGPERKAWPVAVSGTDVVWMRGYPPPSRLQPPDGMARALVVREIAPPDFPKEHASSYEPDFEP
jgi:tRNA(Ile)-lysidine synthase